MTTEKATYRDRIVQDPTILVGKPVVKGTRIPVDLVLAYLERNPNFDELVADYPRLTMADVQACLAYRYFVDYGGEEVVEGGQEVNDDPTPPGSPGSRSARRLRHPLR
jgi:uncharacterized protein (DUF433 family)